jgi:putative cardiolipin synthase
MLPQKSERPFSAAQQPSPDSPLVRIARDSTPSPEQTGFRLMPLGVYALDARVQLARRARHSLDLQYYQINNDKTGRLLLRNLRDASMRGVRVRLLIDDLYTTGGDDLFVGLAAFPNIEVRLFNPFCCGRGSLTGKYTTSLADFGRLNHRMHNKLFIADGAIAVAGGRNIADEYFMRSATDNFVDMDGFIVGALCRSSPRSSTPTGTVRRCIRLKTSSRPISIASKLQRRFNSDVDDGEQMMALTLPQIDILGYGPISDDLDAGRLGLYGARRRPMPTRRRR